MESTRFDLVEIIKALLHKKKFILLVTAAAAAIGLAFSFLQKKEYTSKAIVITKAFETLDRTKVFHTTMYAGPFFANNDDIDQVVTVIESDTLARYIAAKYQLAKVYGFKNEDDAAAKFKSKFKFKREDTKNLEISYTDSDPKRAFEINKDAVDKLENTMRDYMLSINNDMVKILEVKSKAINDTLKVLNDSISSIRKANGLSNALLPTRGEHVIQNASAASGNAEAMEQLQNVTSLKDQYLKSLNEIVGLLQEYKVNAETQKASMFYRVQEPSMPNGPSSPNKTLVLLIAVVAGFFFASLLVVFTIFYKYAAYKLK